jgi:hypothetical protein
MTIVESGRYGGVAVRDRTILPPGTIVPPAGATAGAAAAHQRSKISPDRNTIQDLRLPTGQSARVMSECRILARCAGTQTRTEIA